MTVQGVPLDFNGTQPGSRADAATRMSVVQLADMLNDRIAGLARGPAAAPLSPAGARVTFSSLLSLRTNWPGGGASCRPALFRETS